MNAVGAFDPQRGEIVAVRTATGQWLRKIALSRIQNGRDFPVVWLAWEGQEDQLDGQTPWPCEDVRPISEHPDALSRADYQRAVDSQKGAPDA